MSRRTTARQNPSPENPRNRQTTNRQAATRQAATNPRRPRLGGSSTAPQRSAAGGRARRSTTRSTTTRLSFSALAATTCTVLLTLLLLGHWAIPNDNGFGSLAESFLPWIGVPLALFGLVGAVARSRMALIASGCAALAWCAMFGQTFLPHGPDGVGNLRVISHNVYAANPDPAGTARSLRTAGADLIALQEITRNASEPLHAELDSHYAHRYAEGTLAVWSKHPLSDIRPVDVGMGWIRALRMNVDTPEGTLRLYVVHLASIRFNSSGLASQRRDTTLRVLSETLSADPAKRLLLVGDLNTASTDRSLGGLTSQLTDVQDAAGQGFGFTWPTQFPMVRVDHMLSRGVTVTDAEVLAGTGSDHRPIRADFTL